MQRNEEHVIRALERKEVEDATAVAKGNELLKKLKASRAHVREEHAAARDRAVSAKREKHNALELEIAKIKKQDAKKLAALSHKLNALNNKTAPAAAAHRKQGSMMHQVKAKAEVKVHGVEPAAAAGSKKGAPMATLAQKFVVKGSIKKAFSALAADEAADDKEIKMDKLVQLPRG